MAVTELLTRVHPNRYELNDSFTVQRFVLHEGMSSRTPSRGWSAARS